MDRVTKERLKLFVRHGLLPVVGWLIFILAIPAALDFYVSWWKFCMR